MKYAAEAEPGEKGPFKCWTCHKPATGFFCPKCSRSYVASVREQNRTNREAGLNPHGNPLSRPKLRGEEGDCKWD